MSLKNTKRLDSIYPGSIYGMRLVANENIPVGSLVVVDPNGRVSKKFLTSEVESAYKKNLFEVKKAQHQIFSGKDIEDFCKKYSEDIIKSMCNKLDQEITARYNNEGPFKVINNKLIGTDMSYDNNTVQSGYNLAGSAVGIISPNNTTYPATVSSVIATQPKLTVSSYNGETEKIALHYQGIQHNFDGDLKQIVRCDLNLTFGDIENLVKFVKQARKDYKKRIAEAKKSQIAKAKEIVKLNASQLKQAKQHLAKVAR